MHEIVHKITIVKPKGVTGTLEIKRENFIIPALFSNCEYTKCPITEPEQR